MGMKHDARWSNLLVVHVGSIHDCLFGASESVIAGWYGDYFVLLPFLSSALLLVETTRSVSFWVEVKTRHVR